MEDCVNFHSQQYWPTLLDCYYTYFAVCLSVGTFFLMIALSVIIK